MRRRSALSFSADPVERQRLFRFAEMLAAYGRLPGAVKGGIPTVELMRLLLAAIEDRDGVPAEERITPAEVARLAGNTPQWRRHIVAWVRDNK